MFDPTTKILIVDDMMTMRKIVGKACKELGFTDLVEQPMVHLLGRKLQRVKLRSV